MTDEKKDLSHDERIEMLNEPLLTEEGFLNEACVKELSAAINNLPGSHDRFADDPEWSIKAWTADNEILGFLAASVVECHGQAPLGIAPVINYVKACLRDVFFRETCDQTDRFRLAELSLCDISRFLHKILIDDELTMFIQWNDAEQVGKNWIDLYACLSNVCIHIRDQRRHRKSFNEKFEREHGGSDDRR